MNVLDNIIAVINITHKVDMVIVVVVSSDPNRISDFEFFKSFFQCLKSRKTCVIQNIVDYKSDILVNCKIACASGQEQEG